MEDKSLLEKITLFLVCLCFPGLLLCLILDMYSNYKVHEFIKFHQDYYVYHDYCQKVGSFYACVDEYVVSTD